MMRLVTIGAALALAAVPPSGCREEPAEPRKAEKVNELIRELDTGVEEVVHPPVTVFVAKEAEAAGVTVNRATEGSTGDEGNEIRLVLALSQLVKQRVMLHAYDADNVEQGRAVSPCLNQPAGSVQEVSVYFSRNLSLRGIRHYNMELIPPKAVVLTGDAVGPVELHKGKEQEPLRLRLGQMQEDAGPPIRVTQYLIFDTAFEGELQLRAFDGSRSEIGRSQKIDGIKEGADASRTFEFVFHETLLAGSVESYELFVRRTDEPKGRKNKKKR
ncbi:MAG: hypothetical protein M0R80_21975 [Proteobacteria bacterium]|jgi:hypothetical protein|nr:hypothetical protein [Pseudomonadota bacterium]